MITASPFRPAWWLPGPHLQTLYPSLFRRRVPPPLVRERLELPDGDFLDLDWTTETGGMVVLVLHGLEGSLESHYASGILAALSHSGFTAVLMYFRNCSGTPNRLPRTYHSGETGDLAYVMQHIRTRHPGMPLAAIGYSLGGNVLLKWLGEQGSAAPLATAVAISVPFDLNACALKLEHGISRIYQHHLINRLRKAVISKARVHPPPFPLERLGELRTFRQFDDAVTAPLHGFRDVDDYYSKSSSRPFIRDIHIPTLIIHAADDPFIPAAAIPADGDLSPAVTLELSRHGGHVGFVTGPHPAAPRYWLEPRVIAHLQDLDGAPSPGVRDTAES